MSLFASSAENCFQFCAVCRRLAMLSDARSTLRIAPDGQTFAHGGSPPHRSHLIIRRPTESYEVHPKGQTCMHILHSMQRVLLTTRAPVRASSWIACSGQAVTQAACSHCRHITGAERSSPPRERTETRDRAGLNSPSCAKEQASSQALHPVHFSGDISKTPIGLLPRRRRYSRLFSLPF